MTTFRQRCRWLVAGGLLLTVAPQARADTPLDYLKRKLAELAKDARLGGGRVCYAVMRVRDGQVLAQGDARRQVSVASNAKIVTSAAALALLGSDFRFKTEVFASRPKAGIVAGDIYLKGYGDPSLTDADLWRLASLLRDAGVREIKGGLVIDESYFDRKRSAPLFSSRKSDAYYRPVNGALSVNENVVSVRVRGADKPGGVALLSVIPRSSYIKVRNLVRTVNRRRRSYVRIATRGRGLSTRLTVRGRVRVGYRGRRYRKRIEHPGLFVGATFVELLERRGIKIHRKGLRRGAVPAELKRPILTQRSRPLGELVRRMNKASSNFMAEQVLKVLGAEIYGAPGRWENGLRAVARYLAKVGVPAGTYVLKNGSGLYDATGFSAMQLVRVLRAAQGDFRYGADFVSSLAVAATDGTLAHRFVGTGVEGYLRAKTGTLSNVVSLSGFAGASAAKLRSRLAFSILLSELPDGRIRVARRVADEMAQAIVTYLDR